MITIILWYGIVIIVVFLNLSYFYLSILPFTISHIIIIEADDESIIIIISFSCRHIPSLFCLIATKLWKLGITTFMAHIWAIYIASGFPLKHIIFLPAHKIGKMNHSYEIWKEKNVICLCRNSSANNLFPPQLFHLFTHFCTLYVCISYSSALFFTRSVMPTVVALLHKYPSEAIAYISPHTALLFHGYVHCII